MCKGCDALGDGKTVGNDGGRGPDTLRGDFAGGDIFNGDLNRGDINNGDLNRGDRNRGDNNRGDVRNGDINRGDNNRGDHNRGDTYNGDTNPPGTSDTDTMPMMGDMNPPIMMGDMSPPGPGDMNPPMMTGDMSPPGPGDMNPPMMTGDMSPPGPGDMNGATMMGDMKPPEPGDVPTMMGDTGSPTFGDNNGGGLCTSDDSNMNDTRGSAVPIGTLPNMGSFNVPNLTTCLTDPDWYSIFVDGPHRARIIVSYGALEAPSFLGLFSCSSGLPAPCAEGGGTGMAGITSWTCTSPPGVADYCLRVTSLSPLPIGYSISVNAVP